MVDTSKFFGNNGFNPDREYRKSQNTVAPEGRYRFQITEVKPEVENRAGNGGHAEFTLELDGGPDGYIYTLWVNMNLYHEDARARYFAKRDFAQLCMSVDFHENLQDPDDLLLLLNYQGMCDVKIKPAQGDFKESNFVEEYLVGDNADVVAQQQDGAVHDAPTDEVSSDAENAYTNAPPAEDYDDEDVPF